MYHIFSYFKNLKHISWKRVICILALFAWSTCFAIDDSEMMQNIVSFMNVVFAMITALLTPAVILAWWLLTPDWTMGDFFGLRPYFLNVWILVSNLVYIAFAMILLFLAVMQIFWGEDAEYTFKKNSLSFWLVSSWFRLRGWLWVGHFLLLIRRLRLSSLFLWELLLNWSRVRGARIRVFFMIRLFQQNFIFQIKRRKSRLIVPPQVWHQEVKSVYQLQNLWLIILHDHFLSWWFMRMIYSVFNQLIL